MSLELGLLKSAVEEIGNRIEAYDYNNMDELSEDMRAYWDAWDEFIEANKKWHKDNNLI